MPLEQLVHDDVPVELWYLPLAQLEHELYVCELRYWYLPAAHFLHLELLYL